MTDKPTFLHDAGLARPDRKPRLVQRFKLEDVERAEEEKLRKMTEVVVPKSVTDKLDLGKWLPLPGQIILTHPKRLPVNIKWDFWLTLALGLIIGATLMLLLVPRP